MTRWAGRAFAAPPAAAKVAAVLGPDGAAERRSQPASTSGREADASMHTSSRARRQQPAWESGYLPEDTAGIRFLDMAHMAAEYEATVFPEVSGELDPARAKLCTRVQQALRSCTSVDEVLAVTRPDLSALDPDTVVLAMKKLAGGWVRHLRPAAAAEHRQESEGQPVQQQRHGTDGQAQVDAAMAAFLAQLVADVNRVRLAHVASAVYHMGRARLSLPQSLQPAHAQQTSGALSASAPQPSSRGLLGQQPRSTRSWGAPQPQLPLPLPAPSPPSAASCLSTLLQLTQPDLFLATPDSLGELAQGLGYLWRRRQRDAGKGGIQGTGAAAAVGAGPAGPAWLPPGWVQAFCKVAQSKFLVMDAQQLARVGWGVMQLEVLPDPFWVSGFIARAKACLPQASPSTISYFTWLLMHMDRLARADSKWLLEYQRYNSLWDETGVAMGMNGGNTSSSSGSGSGLLDQQWAESVWDVLEGQTAGMAPRQLAMLLHGMSVLGLRPRPATMEGLAAFLENKGGVMTPMQDCQVLGSLARWGNVGLPQATMSTYLHRIHARLPAYAAPDLHHILWALSAMGPQPFLPPRPWLATWLVCAKPALRSFGPAGIVTVLKSFSIWHLCPPKEFMQDVLEVSAGLARARMLSPVQLSRVVRGVCDLRLHLSVDPAEPDRPPRWSREVLSAFAGMAGAAGPAELAAVCCCLPRLLRPGRPRDDDRGGSGTNSTGDNSTGAAPVRQPAAQASGSPGFAVTAAGNESRAVGSSGKAGTPLNAEAGAGATADDAAARRQTSMLSRSTPESTRSGADAVSGRSGSNGSSGSSGSSSPALHPLALQPVTAIATACAGQFEGMTGAQLVGVLTGLSGVQFPASSGWMEAHARALAARVPELAEGQVEVVERAYARMRRCRLRAARAAAAAEQPSIGAGAGGASVAAVVLP